MDMIIEMVSGATAVTILKVRGALDGSNYRDLIAKARELHAGGDDRLILNLSECPYMSSAGLVALHSIVILLQGGEVADTEEGWAQIHQVVHAPDHGTQSHLVLLKPTPRVAQVLEMAGLEQFLPVFNDLDSALAAFAT